MNNLYSSFLNRLSNYFNIMQINSNALSHIDYLGLDKRLEEIPFETKRLFEKANSQALKDNFDTLLTVFGGVDRLVPELLGEDLNAVVMLPNAAIIDACTTDEQKEDFYQAIIGSLNHPHQLKRDAERYCSGPLSLALFLLPSKYWEQVKLSPDLTRDVARVALWICNVEEHWRLLPHLQFHEQSTSNLNEDSPLIPLWRRSFHQAKKLIPQLKEPQLKELFPLIEAQPGCLGPFLYSLSQQQWKYESVNELLNNRTQRFNPSGLYSLFVLADTNLYLDRLTAVIKRFLKNGITNLGEVSGFIQFMHQSLSPENRIDAERLWSAISLPLPPALIPLWLYENQQSSLLRYWQWSPLLNNVCSSEQLSQLDQGIQDLFDQKIRIPLSRELLAAFFLSLGDKHQWIDGAQNLFKELEVWWNTQPERLVLEKYAVCVGVFLRLSLLNYSPDHLNSAWVQLITRFEHYGKTLDSLKLALIMMGRELNDVNRIFIMRLYASSLAFYSTHTAEDELNKVFPNAPPTRLIHSILLLSHRNLGISKLKKVYSERDYPDFWHSLECCKAASPEEYPLLIADVASQIQPDSDQLLGLLDETKYSNLAQPFIPLLKGKRFQAFLSAVNSQLHINVFPKIRRALLSTEQNTRQNLPLYLLRVYQGFTPDQLRIWLESLRVSHPVQTLLYQFWAERTLVNTISDAHKLSQLVLKLNPQVLPLDFLYKAVQDVAFFDRALAQKLAKHCVQAKEKIAGNSVEGVGIQAIANKRYRQQILKKKQINDTLRQVIPNLTPWLTNAQLKAQCKIIGLHPFVERHRLLTQAQRTVLRQEIERQVKSLSLSYAERKRLSLYGQTLGMHIEPPSSTEEEFSESNPFIESIPQAYRSSPAAAAELLRGKRGEVHLEVIKNIEKRLEITEQDLDDLDLDRIGLHVILMHQVRNQLDQYDKNEHYEQTLKTSLTEWLKSNHLMSRAAFIDYLKQQ